MTTYGLFLSSIFPIFEIIYHCQDVALQDHNFTRGSLLFRVKDSFSFINTFWRL